MDHSRFVVSRGNEPNGEGEEARCICERREGRKEREEGKKRKEEEEEEEEDEVNHRGSFRREDFTSGPGCRLSIMKIPVYLLLHVDLPRQTGRGPLLNPIIAT